MIHSLDRGLLWTDRVFLSISESRALQSRVPFPAGLSGVKEVWSVFSSHHHITSVWISVNAHGYVKAIPHTINAPTAESVLWNLPQRFYFILPQATAQANINEIRPLKRNKHLNKIYALFIANQLNGSCNLLGKIKGKTHLGT